MKKLCTAIVVVALGATAFPALAAQSVDEFLASLDARQAFPERAPGAFDRAAVRQHVRELHDWLVSERVEQGLRAPVRIQVRRDEVRQILRERAGERRFKIGLDKDVDAPVDLGGLAGRLGRGAERLAYGAARGTADGGFVWTGAAASDGALGLRLHFTGFDLPARTELYVYNDAGDAFGPYTGRGPGGSGDFWSHTVAGSLAYVQLRHYGDTPPATLGAVSFRLAGVGHIDPDLVPTPSPRAGSNLCSYNASCVVSAACSSSSAVADAEDAVARIDFVSGAYIYLCSGGLLADTDSSTQIPYFLTAHHCISKGNEASSLEAFFQYRTSSCGGACYDPSGVAPRVLGSSIVSTSSKNGDYTLLRLSQAAPAGSAFMGWNSTPVAGSDNTHLYRISHPQGAPQAYSEHVVDTSAGTCRSWPRGGWIYSRDVVGATEGGSSGSPVVNSAGQVVGQLSGGCGYNVNDVCDTASNATVDGAFAAYYSSVAQYLDPTSGGGGGGGGGGSCSAKGDSCSSDADCCSGLSCRGGRNKTCR